MKVTFTRTGERRYRVSVEGPGVVSAVMDPAPGYDPRMPHDMAHFIVENELRIRGGVFGQLAAGGHAGTFRPTGNEKRRKARTGDKIAAAYKNDALLSERIVDITCRRWNNNRESAPPVKGLKEEDIEMVCRRFDEVSAEWSRLNISESITLEWKHR